MYGAVGQCEWTSRLNLTQLLSVFSEVSLAEVTDHGDVDDPANV